MPGVIERSLVGVTDPKEVSRIRAQGMLSAFMGLPVSQRISFTYDKMIVTFVALPKVFKDKSNRIVGLEVRARGKVQGVNLPFIDGVHLVINPPTKVPDGTTSPVVRADGTTIQVPNYIEDPVTALKMWLVESIRTEARAAGWVG